MSASQASPRPFAIYERELDEQTKVISVEGELDLSTAPRLKWMLLDALEADDARAVADLSLVGFMDSTALGVLVGVQRKLSDGSRFAIVCTSEKVLQIFEFSGIDSAFAIFPTLEQALAHVGSQLAQAG
ncbi:MAG TPA: STAS domain-containing protein [Solirubrobacteraceae bacterium]|nr:STAS domain-containing protein [Solirubrobacteraceae bacterium]